eukprot:scaffold14470_cov4517-Alexandrium_tamarense.AAC.1
MPSDSPSISGKPSAAPSSLPSVGPSESPSSEVCCFGLMPFEIVPTSSVLTSFYSTNTLIALKYPVFQPEREGASA